MKFHDRVKNFQLVRCELEEEIERVAREVAQIRGISLEVGHRDRPTFYLFGEDSWEVHPAPSKHYRPDEYAVFGSVCPVIEAPFSAWFGDCEEFITLVFPLRYFDDWEWAKEREGLLAEYKKRKEDAEAEASEEKAKEARRVQWERLREEFGD